MSYGGGDNSLAEQESENQDVSMDQSLLEPQVDIVEEKKYDYEEKPTVDGVMQRLSEANL